MSAKTAIKVPIVIAKELINPPHTPQLTPIRKDINTSIRPIRHSCSRGYCPIKYNKGDCMTGRQSASTKIQRSTTPVTKKIKIMDTIVSRLLYQLLNRFSRIHVRKPGGAGGREVISDTDMFTPRRIEFGGYTHLKSLM
jgi:hypothetical protein